MVAHEQELQIVVVDVETTGMSPERGDRVIEVGAVKLSAGRISERFERLVNPGISLPASIQALTGIDGNMLHTAPSPDAVMGEFSRFIRGCALVAHNAAFDGKFLQSEFERAGLTLDAPFCCTLKLSRRLWPDAPNHRLESLVRYRGLQAQGSFHRALADADMTTALILSMMEDLRRDFGISRLTYGLLDRIGRTPRRQVRRILEELAVDERKQASLFTLEGPES